MPGETKINVVRQTDAQVLSAFTAFAKEAKLTVDLVEVTMPAVGKIVHDPRASNPDLSLVLEQNTEMADLLLGKMTGQPNLNITVSVHRQREDLVDTAKLNITSSSQNPNAREIGIVGAFRKHLKAADSEKSLKSALGEKILNHYRVREMELSKLESISQSLIIKQEEYRQKLEADYENRKVQLEKRQDEMDSKVKEKEEALAKRIKEVDDRASRHARREISLSLKKELQKRSQEFVLSKGTRALRKPVNVFTFILLTALGGSLILMLLVSSGVLGTMPTDAIAFHVRQATFALAFGSVSYFFLRWHVSYFQRHAKEEFALKRLDIDLDRANWAAELSSEWVDERKKEIPLYLLERITSNLFKDEGEQEEPKLHPADYLASAIFGASANAKVKVGNAELEFDRKSFQKLKMDELPRLDS